VSEEMIIEGNDVTKGFEALRTGFIFSLTSLCLFLFMHAPLPLYGLPYSVLSYLGRFLVYVFPFVILAVWAYGAHKRVEGWKQVGQKSVADKLSLSWKINFFFIALMPFIVFFLPLPYVGLGPVGNFLNSPFALLLWGIETCFVWGYSTVCEARGMKKLEEEKKIRLGLSRICSLAAIFVYAIFMVLGYESSLIGYPYSFFGFVVVEFLPFYSFSILANALVFASPLLIISCINAIVQLKDISDKQTQVSETSSS
jgi:hypothetical protein